MGKLSTALAGGIFCLGLSALSFSSATAQDTAAFKPSGKLWGYAFGDYAFKAHGDTVGGAGRGGSNQYSNVNKNQSLFQLRRLYLGYDYEISKKFSASFLLAAEDDFANGDLLGDGKFAPYIKNAYLRWKGIFPGSDLVIGMQPTPTFAKMNSWGVSSEDVWSYRSIERTVMDVRRTSSFDLGISLQGHLPKNDNFGYDLMVSNGTGSKPETDAMKWFWGDVYGKFLNKHLLVNFYADYNRLNLQEGWKHDRNTFKLFVAYTVPKLTVGVEAFAITLRGDDVATEATGGKKDTISTAATGISAFVRGPILKDKLGFFVRYDNYNPTGDNDNGKYSTYSPLTSQYNPNTKEQFFTAGLDYTPIKNVHIMPNIWYDAYTNAGPKNYGSANKDFDMVYRLTFYYIYGK
ncbi:hypothetical protein ACTHGU_18530 [Chitinophagaceae bacterium MMS25-I14]